MAAKGRAGGARWMGVGLILALAAPVSAQGIEGVPLFQRVARVYQAVVGTAPPQGSGLRDQIDAAAQIIYGAEWQSKMPAGLDPQVNQLLVMVSLGDPRRSLLSRMLAIEWGLNRSLYEWELAEQGALQLPSPPSPGDPPLRPLRERVAWAERLIYGKEQPGGLVDRVDRLAQDVWGSAGAARLDTKVVKVSGRAGQVRIRLLATISNERDRASVEGQLVPFIVVDPLVLEGALVLPRGALGFVRVDEVQTPTFGRPGRLSASGFVWAIDGILLGATLGFDEQVAAAPINPVGAAFSGPVAAPTGILVQGAARTFPAGTILVAAIGPTPGRTEVPVINAIVQ